MTGPHRAGRYLLRAYLRGEQVSDPAAGWDDLADPLLRAVDLADDAATRGRTDCAWIIHDRSTGDDLVRVDIAARVTYLS